METVLPVDAAHWLAAFLPLLVLLVLMIGFRWGATDAGPIGWGLALIISFAMFGADWQVVAIGSTKGIWDAVFILYVIWPAILIYHVTRQADAFDPFRQAIEKITPHKLLLVFAFGWVFPSFLQGITGFGVPIAVGAPLLIGLGVRPLYAVVIPLAAHAWANTFGTLAVAWEALKLVTDIQGQTEMVLTTAIYAGIFLWILNIMGALIVAWLYGRGKGIREALPAIVIISLIHGGGQLLLTQWNQILSAFIPAVVALGVVFLLGKTPWYSKPSNIKSKIFEEGYEEFSPPSTEPKMSGNQSFFPYYVLLIVTLGVSLIQPLNELFSQWQVGFAMPATTTALGYQTEATEAYSAFAPLTHAGTFLLIAAFAGFLYFKSKGFLGEGDWGKIARDTNQKTMPASIAVIALVTMSQIMGGTGQTEVLAFGVAEFTGPVYALLAPFVGVLGAFMTSSNMASNILFGNFQLTTAEVLGLKESAILAAQTSGGAIGNTIAPGNVLLGTTTAGILGREGDVLKYTLVVALIVAFVTGLVVMAVA